MHIQYSRETYLSLSCPMQVSVYDRTDSYSSVIQYIKLAPFFHARFLSSTKEKLRSSLSQQFTALRRIHMIVGSVSKYPLVDRRDCFRLHCHSVRLEH